MYSALIEIGWIRSWFCGETAMEIARGLEDCQNFDCLLSMASGREDPTEYAKLCKFYEKYLSGELTFDDIKNLDITFTIAKIKCHDFKEG